MIPERDLSKHIAVVYLHIVEQPVIKVVRIREYRTKARKYDCQFVYVHDGSLREDKRVYGSTNTNKQNSDQR